MPSKPTANKYLFRFECSKVHSSISHIGLQPHQLSVVFPIEYSSLSKQFIRLITILKRIIRIVKLFRKRFFDKTEVEENFWLCTWRTGNYDGGDQGSLQPEEKFM